MVMEQAGVEEFPGPLPAVNVVRHVTPMKSPPAAKTPSIVTDNWLQFEFAHKLPDFHNLYQTSHSVIHHIIELLN